MSDIKKISVKDFREQGYLQELNRRFLHPLGLALEVVVDDDGNERFGEVWDYRDDPEGIIFGEEMINAVKAAKIHDEWHEKVSTRVEGLGYMIQPADDVDE